MEYLLQEYRETLRWVNRARERAKAEGREEDRASLADCATSISYIISWLEYGREPGSRRGAASLAGYQREIPFDPNNAFFVRECALHRKTKAELNQKQQGILDDLLAMLTDREYEAFMMVRGNGLSFGQAAERMRVNKGTVQNLVGRAERKLHLVVRKPPNSEGKLSKPVQRVLFVP